MELTTEELVRLLIENISSMEEVESIGISGGDAPYPRAGEGDIDVFIYCDSIPDDKKRQDVLYKINNIVTDIKLRVFESVHWGTGDYVLMNGIETWLMYFIKEETLLDAEAILSGKYPDKQDNYYYPIGRLAMLKNINVKYDRKQFLSSLKHKLSIYPDELAAMVREFHLNALVDTEDLERAIGRKDVLFYHFSIDQAIDHFLQALFALNKTFFPSRKRSLEYMNSFELKPDQCGERLLEVIRLAAYPESIEKSYASWCSLVDELSILSSHE